MIDPSRKQAAAEFELPADADAPAVRTAFLRKLPAFDYAPPEDWYAAAARLGAGKFPLTADAIESAVGYERADVEAFAEAYWSLTPEERRRRWSELNGRCRVPEVRTRLGNLQAGLDVPVYSHQDSALEDTVRFARELYLLPPREGGLRRLEWCARRAKSTSLPLLARQFQLGDPATAALVPQLMQSMAQPEPLEVAALSPREIEWIETETARRERKARREREPEVVPRLTESGGWNWKGAGGGLFVVILLIRVFLALAGSNKSTTAPPPVYQPAYKSSYYAPPTYQQTPTFYTAEQVRTFEHYDPNSGLLEPPGYAQWKRNSSYLVLPKRSPTFPTRSK